MTEPHVVILDDKEVVVFEVDGYLYGIANRCPHRAGPLSRGRLENIDGTLAVRCPMHGWLFDLKTGQCLNQPAVSVETFPMIKSFVMQLPSPLPEQAKKIIEKIIGGYAPQAIYLFGSYAWGQPHEDSDLDLLIVKETSARRIDREVEVAECFESSDRRLPVDVIVLTPQEVERRRSRKDPFVEMIVSEGHLLYAA